MAVKRFTGVDMVLQLETSSENYVTVPNITEVRVEDGQAEKVEFQGGTSVQVAHGLPKYRLEADMEIDDTNASTGNTYVCVQVTGNDETPAGLKFYPYGTSGARYFQLDALFELSALDTLSKNGKGMQMLEANEHVQASLSPGWQGIPEASA